MAKKVSLKLIGSESEFLKKYKDKAGRASIIVPSKENTLWLPTDVIALNHLLGGGIPYGRILEILGFESTGKSLLAMSFVRACQSLGGVATWIDAERAWNNGWAEENGVNVEELFLYEDEAVEPISDYIRDFIVYQRSILTKNEPILIVLDSIAALETEENIDSDQADGKAEMGNRAKALYRMYRKRNKFLGKYGAILIAINQIRDKVGATMFESAETSPGGKATAFYASQRLGLGRGKQVKFKVKGREKKMGQNVYFQTKKNKVGPPSDSVNTQVHFRPEMIGYVGYHKYMGLPDVLQDEGVIKKKGSRYYFKDQVIGNGEEGFVKVLGEDKELRSKLLKRSTVNTVAKTRKKLESIETNLYPVKLKAQSDDEQ